MTKPVATVAEHAKESGASIAAMLCRTIGLSRATFYRTLDPVTFPEEPGTDLREDIQKITRELPCHGYRRVTAQIGAVHSGKNAKIERHAFGV
jgi:hypothetical protein